MRPIKRNSKAVAWIAGLILFMQLVFMYYQVMPDFPPTSLSEHWMDFLVPIGIGGNLAGAFPVAACSVTACCRCTTTIGPPPCTCGISTPRRRPARRHLCSWIKTSNRQLAQLREQHRGDETQEICHPDGRIEHPAVRYEPKDIRIGWLLAVVVGVCCYAAVHYYGVWRFLWFGTSSGGQEVAYPRRPPVQAVAAIGWHRTLRGLRRHSTPLPPEPRLEQLDRMTPEESAATCDKQLAAKEKPSTVTGRPRKKGSCTFPSNRP